VSDRQYREIVDGINQVVGRKAVTVDQLKRLVAEGRYIRQTQGMMALWHFAQGIPQRFLTEEETELLRQSPRYHELSQKTLNLLVKEGLLSSMEARMLRRYL
jgi:hypothetical protein